ncbi:hypothetical protein M0813_23868 [Anaeramoeba flamelloides]|uniref:Uncharacterized protein n=1 Tax=Anaeramoeba flamelloides TaxID=1746091 RepID=A0ABQ8Y808_9EUKA|nr:hypothetical protein M0813_23868 [Anaeramoeba flamelloides]
MGIKFTTITNAKSTDNDFGLALLFDSNNAIELEISSLFSILQSNKLEMIMEKKDIKAKAEKGKPKEKKTKKGDSSRFLNKTKSETDKNRTKYLNIIYNQNLDQESNVLKEPFPQQTHLTHSIKIPKVNNQKDVKTDPLLSSNTKSKIFDQLSDHSSENMKNDNDFFVSQNYINNSNFTSYPKPDFGEIKTQNNFQKNNGKSNSNTVLHILKKSSRGGERKTKVENLISIKPIQNEKSEKIQLKSNSDFENSDESGETEENNSEVGMIKKFDQSNKNNKTLTKIDYEVLLKKKETKIAVEDNIIEEIIINENVSGEQSGRLSNEEEEGEEGEEVEEGEEGEEKGENEPKIISNPNIEKDINNEDNYKRGSGKGNGNKGVRGKISDNVSNMSDEENEKINIAKGKNENIITIKEEEEQKDEESKSQKKEEIMEKNEKIIQKNKEDEKKEGKEEELKNDGESKIKLENVNQSLSKENIIEKNEKELQKSAINKNTVSQNKLDQAVQKDLKSDSYSDSYSESDFDSDSDSDSMAIDDIFANYQKELDDEWAEENNLN